MAAASSSSSAPPPAAAGADAAAQDALKVGCQVFVKEAFEYPEYQLAKDLLGVVQEIDGCGDAFINWQVVGKKWVLKRDLQHIGVKKLVLPSSSVKAAEEKKGLPSFTFKTVVVGTYSVGKSSLALRFVKGTFSQGVEPTIGATFMTQTVVLDDMKVKLEIWDTAGQERYKSLAPIYLRGAAVMIVVYDVTNRATWDAARTWVEEVRQESPGVIIFLVGNKTDLGAQKRKVSRAEAEGHAAQARVTYSETSAKTGENVSVTFQKVAAELRLRHNEQPAPGAHAFTTLGAESGQQAAARSSCCSS